MIRVALVVVCVLSCVEPARAADPPRVVVEKVSEAVLAVLADQKLTTAERRQRIEQIVYANVEFDTLARLVLARHWSQFTPAQQAAFVQEFKRHLSLTYGRNVDLYKGQRVVVLGDRAEVRGDWMVHTKIVGGEGDDVHLDYRLRQTDGEWKIIDFIIEEVSLVANYRSQFQEILSSRPPERLIAMLHEKNERGQALKAPGASKE